jgi:hypothetical protein
MASYSDQKSEPDCFYEISNGPTGAFLRHECYMTWR